MLKSIKPANPCGYIYIIRFILQCVAIIYRYFSVLVCPFLKLNKKYIAQTESN